MDLFLSDTIINFFLPFLAIIAALFVITTQNPIYSVFNLIVLYILVAFFLIFKGITYIGLSYIIIYVGAIAILFLFILMMIDLEIVEKRNNNYLPLLFLLLVGSVLLLKSIVIKYGLIKFENNNLKFEKIYCDNSLTDLNSIEFNLFQINNNENLELHAIPNSHLDLRIESIIFRDSNYNILDDTHYNQIFDKDSTNLVKIYNLNQKFDYDNNLDNSFINSKVQVMADNYYHTTDSLISNGLFLIKDLFNIEDSYYMVFIPNWENAINRVTHISAIGDILYSVYHSYIYILSVILLLGMVGAILLTSEKNEEIRVIPIIKKRSFMIPAFFNLNFVEQLDSEGIIDSLSYFVFVVLFIGILLFGVNTYLSLSVKYLDKEGGFECGFTSFVQTRERFNIIFYRVALLFLIFDLEIILIFPYTAIYHNNQSISKNNVLAFLYILVVGFIFELKEGALEIVKKAHSLQLDIKN